MKDCSEERKLSFAIFHRQISLVLYHLSRESIGEYGSRSVKDSRENREGSLFVRYLLQADFLGFV